LIGGWVETTGKRSTREQQSAVKEVGEWKQLPTNKDICPDE